MDSKKIAEIRERCENALSIPDHFRDMPDFKESIRDIPALLIEVERLQDFNRRLDLSNVDLTLKNIELRAIIEGFAGKDESTYSIGDGEPIHIPIPIPNIIDTRPI